MKKFQHHQKSKNGIIIVLTGRITTFYTLAVKVWKTALLPSPVESKTLNMGPRILAILQEFT